jgi:hypothetical protein
MLGDEEREGPRHGLRDRRDDEPPAYTPGQRPDRRARHRGSGLADSEQAQRARATLVLAKRTEDQSPSINRTDTRTGNLQEVSSERVGRGGQ